MYKKLAIHTVIYTIGIVFPRLINYVLLRFLTFYLNRNEFSWYSDMYSLSFFVIGFLSFGLENSYFRFLYKKGYNKKTVFSTIIVIQMIIMSIFFIVIHNFFSEIIYLIGYTNHPEYFVMFCLIIIFDTISMLPMAWLRAHDKSLIYSLINIINILIQSVLTIYMFFFEKSFYFVKKHNLLFFIFKSIYLYTDKTGLIFIANVLSSFINLLLVLIIIYKELSLKKFNFLLAKKIIQYGVPIMLGTVCFSINENLDKILIKRYGSDDINGAYSACYKIASFMGLYIRIFKLGVEPFFFKQSKEKKNVKYNYYEEITYLFILFGLIIYVLICGNISILINFLIDKRYHIALPIIPVIMIGNLFLGIYTNLSIFYKVSDKPIIGTYISLIGVVITFIFNGIFILYSNNKNFMIPAWGTFISYLCMLILLYIWNKKNFLGYYNIVKKIIIHFISAILVVFIVNKINIILSIIMQLLYFLCILFFERKRLLNLVK